MFAVLAEAFRYPEPGLRERIEAGVAGLPAGAVRRHLERFARRVAALGLEEWEVLHTRTLDLGPLAAPYVGHHQWGESYQRGAFLARLNAELRRYGVDADGELPDHLVPVLRYLDVAVEPLPELLENLAPAVMKMHAALREADPDNPYLLAFRAVVEATGEARQVLAGA